MSSLSYSNEPRRADIAGRPAARSARRRRLHVLLLALLGATLGFFTSPAARAAGLPADADERAALRTFLRQTIANADSFADRFDAEVWLLDMSTRLAPFLPAVDERLALLRHIHREARRADLKPDLVLALIQVESRFDRYAISRAGAQGLMQVMPFWKEEIGRPDDNLTDVVTNLRYGCQILRFYMDREEDNWTRALARYNGSLGKTWYPERVMDAWRERWYAGDL